MSFEVILPFFRPIEPLILDTEISEIVVNGSGRIFTERHGQLAEVTDVRISEKHLQIAVRNIARTLGDDVSEEKPLLDARLPDSSRVAAPPPKHKHMSGKWLLLEHRLHLRAQPLKPAPYVGHPRGNPDARARTQFDHGRKLSRIACSITQSAPRSTRIAAPPGNSMWITPQGDANSERTGLLTLLKPPLGIGRCHHHRL